MTTGERMKIRRKEIQATAEHVAELIGVSAATVYRYESGDIEKVPGDLLEPIAKALRTTPQYLMGWEQSPDANMSQYDNILPIPEMRMVPLVGSIACGAPILAEENIEDMVPMPKDVNADFCLRCQGDSMIGARVLDGDLVFIRRQPDVEDGEIAAVLIDNEATLKRVYKTFDRIELRAENPSFPRMTYENEELNEIQILGKAVAFLSGVK